MIYTNSLDTLETLQKRYKQYNFQCMLYAYNAENTVINSDGELVRQSFVKVGMTFHPYQVIRRYITSQDKNTAFATWVIQNDTSFLSKLGSYLKAKNSKTLKAVSSVVEAHENNAHNAIAVDYDKDSEKFSKNKKASIDDFLSIINTVSLSLAG